MWRNVVLRCVIYVVGFMSCDQGAELMSKYGVNVPKGVVCSTPEDVKKATQSLFANESEVIILKSC